MATTATPALSSNVDAAPVASTSGAIPIEGKTIKALTLLHLKRTYDLFSSNHGIYAPQDEESMRLKIALKIRDDYAAAQHLIAPIARQAGGAGPSAGPSPGPSTSRPESTSAMSKLIDASVLQSAKQQAATTANASESSSGSLVVYQGDQKQKLQQQSVMDTIREGGGGSAAVSRRLGSRWPRPSWRAPWKMYRVIAGHLGWVRSVAVDPTNEWFCTGSVRGRREPCKRRLAG